MAIVKVSGKPVHRQRPDSIEEIFSDEQLQKMVERQVETMRKHCMDYPLMPNARKCTITLEICPVPVPIQAYDPAEPIKRAEFRVSVSGASLPKTSKQYTCTVSRNGGMFYNVIEPEEPEQLTQMDIEDAEEILTKEN